MAIYLKMAASAIGVLILALPVTFFLTIFLSPLGPGSKRDTGIESIGHSGPADWCFYLVLAVVGGLMEFACWRIFWRDKL